MIYCMHQGRIWLKALGVPVPRATRPFYCRLLFPQTTRNCNPCPMMQVTTAADVYLRNIYNIVWFSELKMWILKNHKILYRYNSHDSVIDRLSIQMRRKDTSHVTVYTYSSNRYRFSCTALTTITVYCIYITILRTFFEHHSLFHIIFSQYDTFAVLALPRPLEFKSSPPAILYSYTFNLHQHIIRLIGKKTTTY